MFNRASSQVKLFLDKLDRNARLAIVSILIAGMLAMFITVMWTSGPDTAVVSSFSDGNQAEILTALQSAGIEVTQEDGRIVVPVADHSRALAVLADNRLLRKDTSKAYQEMLNNMNPWDSNAVHTARGRIALQQSLSAQISFNSLVRRAVVSIGEDRMRGLGPKTQTQSASVAIEMEGNAKVDQNFADTVAAIVAGAVSGLKPTDVSVNDVPNGKSFVIRDNPGRHGSDAMDHLQGVENYFLAKIENRLSYMDGVIAAVNVQIDNVYSESMQTFKPGDTPILESEVSERTQDSIREAGEPGVRANEGININGGASTNTSQEESKKRDRFGSTPVESVISREMVGRLPKKIDVTIGIPRQQVVAEYLVGQPEGTEEPDDATLAQFQQAVIDRVSSEVKPLLNMGVDQVLGGEVVVTIMPDSARIASVLGLPGNTGGGGAIGSIASGWKSTGMTVGLIAVPLALMLMMVRKATQEQTLPSVEELAGIPPQLPVEDDLIGEAEANDDGMAGVEVDEGELRMRKIAEQISEMIKSNPDEAGSMIGRWVGVED